MNQFYIKCRINFILWDAFGIFYFNYSFSLSLPIIIIFFSIKIIWFAWGRCLTFCLAWNLFILYNLILSLIFYSRSSSKFILSWTWIIFPWRFNFWSSYKNGYWSPSRSPRFDDPVSWNDLPPIWEYFRRSHTSEEFFRSILKLFLLLLLSSSGLSRLNQLFESNVKPRNLNPLNLIVAVFNL